MRLTVKLFAQLRERLGTKALELELPPGATAALLLEQLVAEHPTLAPFRESLLLARGSEMLEPQNALANNDVVALYPPFSGG
ncbi:MAG: MoaD/ThiS family protein [Candidatus Poseidoniia archaeon]|jgi:molybdopterin converting factor small subunit|nr:molybdopterin synthase sulfur carrier subunit [Candidatus Neomarinimicrobiota bacterium]MDP6534667.1 MoaD/ThiS family protein [Candidatus Poseidoniia archaeon]|tara:strand:+ start:169 stop:414 length:246 start_codon:yes stop_codon:yes gene_type:complete